MSRNRDESEEAFASNRRLNATKTHSNRMNPQAQARPAPVSSGFNRPGFMQANNLGASNPSRISNAATSSYRDSGRRDYEPNRPSNTLRAQKSSAPTSQWRQNPQTTQNYQPQQGVLRQPISYSRRTGGEVVNQKSKKALVPLWQDLDRRLEDQINSIKRGRENDASTNKYLQRKSMTVVRRVKQRAPAADDEDTLELENQVPTTVLAPGLVLKSANSGDDFDSDREMVPVPVQTVAKKSFAVKQGAMKSFAARKLESTPASSSEDSDDSQSSTESAPSLVWSSHFDDPTNQIPDIEPVDEEDADPLPTEDNDAPDIILLDTPPRILIPLPQLDPSEQEDFKSGDPPNKLSEGVAALTLTAIRMQKTKQLPFLPRNLRNGFLRRCRQLHLPIYSNGKAIKLNIRYDHIEGIHYRQTVSAWICPVCHLLGELPTREMLDRHLRWDHPEIFCEWEHVRETQNTTNWRLSVVIPEIMVPIEPWESERNLEEGSGVTIGLRLSRQSPEVDEFHNRSSTSIFPSVSLSPPLSGAVRGYQATAPGSPPGVAKVEIQYMQARSTNRIANSSREFSSTRSPQLSPSISSRSRSLTTITTTTTTATSSAMGTTPTPRRELPVVPPPRENPLGPAAIPPYLPAISEYGGPTVYYSTRPGGNCLFDLLNTLPIEDFGVLDWEVLDREDEIYESDDVKEEYRVMHALWARWITLNRNWFIANYAKGTEAFIDTYWKMIHLAAGWDALRYWLMMLIANQFLTVHEVAKLLLHYEKHTAMDSWYED